MGRRFLVQTNFDAKDNMSPTMKKINKGYGRFAADITDKNSTLGRSFGNINKSINRIAMVGIAALTAAIGVAGREYVKFDQTIVGANTRFVDFVKGSEQSAQTLQALKDAARETGATTQFSATEAAAGLNFYAKAGFESAEAMAVLSDTVDLATVAEADFNRAADISSDLLGALGLNAADSGKKIANLKELNRALGIAVNSANVNLEDLFETLKVAGPVGTQAGESMNELVAMTAALGGAGIKGSMGATALKNAYLRLASPTDTIRATLKQVGLAQKDFIDESGNMKSMVTIMGMLGKATEGLGKAEQLQVFGDIFGKNAVAGATNLSKSLAEVEFIMAKLEGDTALKDLADEIRTGLGMQIQILRSGLLELGFQFVEAFEKDGRGALQALIDTVQNMNIEPLIKFAKVTMAVLKFLGKHWRLLLSFAAAIKAVSIALGVVTIATQIFGLTLEATPVGKIITIIALLVAGLTWLALNWDTVTAVAIRFGKWVAKIALIVADFAVMLAGKFVAGLKIAWKWIQNVGQKFAWVLGPVGTLISMLVEIVKQWDDIKAAFQDGGFLAGIMAIGDALLAGLLAPLQGVLELAAKVPGLGRLAEGGAERIASIREGLTEGNTIGTPGTPTPFAGSPGSLNSVVDVNFNNTPENVDIVGGPRPNSGVNLSIKPAVSF